MNAMINTASSLEMRELDFNEIEEVNGGFLQFVAIGFAAGLAVGYVIGRLDK